jgi:hypothetical protein
VIKDEIQYQLKKKVNVSESARVGDYLEAYKGIAEAEKAVGLFDDK